jgi:hypothetical protein
VTSRPCCGVAAIRNVLLGSRRGSSLGLGVILRVLEDMVIAWLELAHEVVAETLRDVVFGYQGGNPACPEMEIREGRETSTPVPSKRLRVLVWI